MSDFEIGCRKFNLRAIDGKWKVYTYSAHVFPMHRLSACLTQFVVKVVQSSSHWLHALTSRIARGSRVTEHIVSVLPKKTVTLHRAMSYDTPHLITPRTGTPSLSPTLSSLHVLHPRLSEHKPCENLRPHLSGALAEPRRLTRTARSTQTTPNNQQQITSKSVVCWCWWRLGVGTRRQPLHDATTTTKGRANDGKNQKQRNQNASWQNKIVAVWCLGRKHQSCQWVNMFLNLGAPQKNIQFRWKFSSPSGVSGSHLQNCRCCAMQRAAESVDPNGSSEAMDGHGRLWPNRLWSALWQVVGLTDFGQVYCFSVLAKFSESTECTGLKKLRLQSQLTNLWHRDRLWRMQWLRLHWKSFSTRRYTSEREQVSKTTCSKTRPLLTRMTNCEHDLWVFPCSSLEVYIMTTSKISWLGGIMHYYQWVKCLQMWSWKDCTRLRLLCLIGEPLETSGFGTM